MGGTSYPFCVWMLQKMGDQRLELSYMMVDEKVFDKKNSIKRKRDFLVVGWRQ